MYYSIGEVAKLNGITISTLRYYDREGLFPNMERSGGGIRVCGLSSNSTIGLTAFSDKRSAHCERGVITPKFFLLN